MHAMKWTKNGWTKTINTRPTTIKDHNGRDAYPIRRRISDVKEDFTLTSPNPEVNEVREAEQEIMFGNAQAFLDQMSPMTRIVYTDPYGWYFAGQKMIKVVDPETQAKTFKKDNKKTDVFDDDAEDKWRCSYLYRGCSLATTLFLERTGLLGEDRSRDFDVLDIFNDDDFQLGGVLERAQINIEWLGQDTASDESDIEEDYCEDDFRVPVVSEFNAPVFPDDIQKDLDKLVDKFFVDIEANPENYEQIRISTEQQIDKLIFDYLVNGFNTCKDYGRYSPPAQSYEFIFNVQESEWSGVANQRKEHFDAKIRSITNCKSMNDLYGPLQQIDDKWTRGGGVYGKLRELYEEDKAIILKWSNDEFNRQRLEYIDSLRANGVDEESLRAKVYAKFDRKSGSRDMEFAFDDILNNIRKGPLVRNSAKWNNSWWIQNKTNDYMNLTFTSGQWNAIHQARELIQRRFKMLKKTKIPEQIEWTNCILEAFGRIDNIAQLNTYKDWLFKRNNIEYKIESGAKKIDLGMAPIDNLTIREEIELTEAISKYKKALIAQIRKSIEIEAEHLESVNTDIPKVHVDCYHLKFSLEGEDGCNRTIYRKPKFLKTDGDKGLLYVNCSCREKGCKSESEGKCCKTGKKETKCVSGCHHKVFIRDNNLKIQEHTLEEWKEILK